MQPLVDTDVGFVVNGCSRVDGIVDDIVDGWYNELWVQNIYVYYLAQLLIYIVALGPNPNRCIFPRPPMLHTLHLIFVQLYQ